MQCFSGTHRRFAMSDSSNGGMGARGVSVPSVDQPPRDAEVFCERCGRPGAVDIAGGRYCRACYSEYGSCCLEFGADDLWALRDDLS